MWNDFNLTNHAYNSCLTAGGLLEHVFARRRVPRSPLARNFKGPRARDYWEEHSRQFPKPDWTAGAAFHLDRIWPVDEGARQALVKRFFQEDEDIQRHVLDNPENADCLVRLYLGRNRRPASRRYNSSDTLRNVPLHLDELTQIGLDVGAFAQEMAMGLAVLHWKAGIDAQDTEFVIGISTAERLGAVCPDHESVRPPDTSEDGFEQGEARLWMLDFDKCSKVDLDEAGSSLPEEVVLDKYLVAVTGNDPYFPHARLDVSLWRRFRDTYIEAGETVIRTNRSKWNRQHQRQVARLPRMLIERWERWADVDVEAQDFDPFERSIEDEQVETQGRDDDTTKRTKKRMKNRAKMAGRRHVYQRQRREKSDRSHRSLEY